MNKNGDIRALVEDRLSSCLLFSEGNCPHELITQRVYLIPQLLTTVEAREYGNACLGCRQFISRLVHLAESEEIGALTLEMAIKEIYL